MSHPARVRGLKLANVIYHDINHRRNPH